MLESQLQAWSCFNQLNLSVLQQRKVLGSHVLAEKENSRAQTPSPSGSAEDKKRGGGSSSGAVSDSYGCIMMWTCCLQMETSEQI